MKRRAGPGSWENGGRGSQGRTEGAIGQQHQGWQARTRGELSFTSSLPAGRSPLKEAPAGNRKGNESSKNLRPDHVPCARNAGSTADGQEDKGMTLRCMYTHQKTKKRKTWSDGAVKCCAKRQRVSLYRWSDALGVTDKLLGEIYLTMPQYEAFVTQGEPELEMETFLVSFDGVIQPDNDNGPSPAGTTSSAAGGDAESATAGDTSGGVAAAGAAGKKRTLFKAFKPPARRAPPPAPPSDDSWGSTPPPGMMGQVRNGESRMDGRGMLSDRTSYTGFDHVESLWDDDEDDCLGGEGMDSRGDRAGPAGSAAERSSAGWGMGAGARCPCPREGGGGAGTFPGRTQSSSSSPLAAAAAAALNTRDWMSGQEEGRHAGGCNTGSGLPRWAGDNADHFPAQQQDMDRFEGGSVDRRQGQDDPSSYLDGLRCGSGGGGTGVWPRPTDRSAQRGGTHDIIDRARDQGHYYPEHPRYDDQGTVAAPEREPIERNTPSPRYGGGARDAPEANREPVGRGSDGNSWAGDGSGGRAGAGAAGVEMRSTQDILSLFGGLEEDDDGGDHGCSPGPRGPETAAATPLQQSRGPNDAPVPPEAARGALFPVGGGMPRAADMRRAQKEARVAAAGGATTAVAGVVVAAAAAAATALAGSADRGTEQPAARSVAASVAPLSEEWTCSVCGVRGGASATSCRVCGAPRQQGPAYEVVSERGCVDEHHGVAGEFSGGDHGHGWDGVDFRGGEDWQEQQWDGVAVDGNADGGRGGVDDLGGGGRGEGVACSSGGVRRTSGEHRMAGARMQIDVGSSSDSDDD